MDDSEGHWVQFLATVSGTSGQLQGIWLGVLHEHVYIHIRTCIHTFIYTYNMQFKNLYKKLIIFLICKSIFIMLVIISFFSNSGVS